MVAAALRLTEVHTCGSRSQVAIAATMRTQPSRPFHIECTVFTTGTPARAAAFATRVAKTETTERCACTTSYDARSTGSERIST